MTVAGSRGTRARAITAKVIRIGSRMGIRAAPIALAEAAAQPADPGNDLTDREREVLRMILKGDTNKSISNAMNISPRTVEVHRAHVMEKMGVRSVAELVHLCHIAGRGGEPPDDS